MARTPNFISHAKIVAGVTLVSRFLGLGREMLAANYFGAGAVWSAFTFAFTIPNLFRKLFGEGALSAAFIPMYARRLTEDDGDARRFAADSVNLLIWTLAIITVVGEAALLGVWLAIDPGRDDYRLAIVLTAIMLPYVVLICGAAFLGGILQTHGRFTAAAAASVLLNVCLIAAISVAAWRIDLSGDEGRARATLWLAAAVVVSGVLQCAMLWPSLRAVGFAFSLRLATTWWTPATRRMVALSLPVALGAGVLQVSVLMDRGIAFLLAEGVGAKTFTVLGQTIRYPLAEGAAARLNWAQFLYQFPLGVFATALATAIFPMLSRAAASGGDGGGARGVEFRDGLRKGVTAALYIGLPASVGLVLVARPAVRVLFERGEFTAYDTAWTSLSVALYASAVWAFSLQQIVNRGFYALQDTRTPLIGAVVNLVANLAVELPLIWTPLREAGMAAGTLVSFSVQTVVMLWILDRRVGGMGLRQAARPVAVMLLATGAMAGACLALRLLPGWPEGTTRADDAVRLGATMLAGGGVYLALTRLGGLRLR